jgi:pectate lyase
MPMSEKVKAALVAGIFVVIAACITGMFLIINDWTKEGIIVINPSRQATTTLANIARQTPELQHTSASAPSQTALPSAQPIASSLFVEDFEDGTADDFAIKAGNWRVVDDGSGNRVLEVDNSGSSVWPKIDFGPSILRDGIIEYRVKLIDYDVSREAGSGMAFVEFRKNAEGGLYAFAFVPYWKLIHMAYQGPSTSWVSIQGQKGESTRDFQKGVWYSVRVEVQGEKIRAYLDDNLVILVEDSKLKEGGLALATGPNTTAQFDDVQVWTLADGQ